MTSPRFANLSPSLPVFAVVLGLMITAGLVAISRMQLISAEDDDYRVEVAQVTDAILQKLTAVEEVLHSMRVVFDASTFVDPDEFRIIAEDALSRHSYMISAMYLPLVMDDERGSFVAARRDEGYQGFDITDLVDDRFVPAPRRPRYFPIIYQEPFAPETVGALGLDMLARAHYFSYIQQAIDSGRSSAAIPERAVDGEFRYTVFKAVYTGKIDADKSRARRAVVNGIVALTLDASQLLGSYNIDELMTVNVDMRSMIDPDRPVPLLRRVGQEVEEEFGHWRFFTFDREDDIIVGSQHFRLHTYKELHWEDVEYRPVLAALLIGLMLTALLWSLARSIKARALDLGLRNEQIRELVRIRTRELAQEKEWAQITLQSIGDAVITTDSKANIEYINAVAEELIGWSTAAARGKPVADVFKIIDELTSEELPNLVHDCLRGGAGVKRQGNCVLLNSRGNTFSIDESAAPIHDRSGTVSGVVLVLHDVSQTRKLTQEMAHQATHDALTGLPNRVLLMDRLQQEFTRAPWSGKIVAVIFLDLDRFKRVNDNLGHDAGDQLIREVGGRLEDCLREGDSVGRLGGDEFVVILTDVAHHDDIRVVANKVIDSFKAPFFLQHQEIYVSASLGISAYPEGGGNPKEIMKNADVAMYRAKSRGKNNFVFYTRDINVKGKRNLSLESDLRRAIERAELLLYYQPQVSLGAEKVIGVEALIRWDHPRRGMLPPGEFIALAEESDLIVDIGRWVLVEACRQAAAWQRMGLPAMSIAVNVADRQFQSSALEADVRHALEVSGLAAEYLDLELTEGILANNAESASRRLDRLKQSGITLSIDDFGTGYSSLAYLKRFPLNTVKVDRSFVRDITSDASDATICAAIIAMAHNLKLGVVAEGVETAQQLAFLRQKGCDSIQGYYFSPPVPADELPGVIERLNTASYGAIARA